MASLSAKANWRILERNSSSVADVDNEYVNVVGMDSKPTVAAYIEMNYGIRHDFIGWVVLIIFAYIIVFLGVAAVSLKKLNFQQK